jgi:hypothetical protein
MKFVSRFFVYAALSLTVLSSAFAEGRCYIHAYVEGYCDDGLAESYCSGPLRDETEVLRLETQQECTERALAMARRHSTRPNYVETGFSYIPTSGYVFEGRFRETVSYRSSR